MHVVVFIIVVQDGWAVRRECCGVEEHDVFGRENGDGTRVFTEEFEVHGVVDEVRRWVVDSWVPTGFGFGL